MAQDAGEMGEGSAFGYQKERKVAFGEVRTDFVRPPARARGHGVCRPKRSPLRPIGMIWP